jgi:hypothetical protein
VTPLGKRLDEIERMLAKIERDVADYRPDPLKMTDAECAEEWHRLCHLHPPGSWRPRPLSPEEEAAIITEWRRLTG